MPIARLPLTISHPRKGGPPMAQARRAAEDVLLDTGAAIFHLPDFYGPHVHTSTLQMALAKAVAAGRLDWIGSAETKRDYIYVPDAVALATELMGQNEAYGAQWIAPGAGPISALEIAEIASRALASEVRLRSAGPTLLRLLGLFDRNIAAFHQMVPEYLKPVSYDGSELEALIGKVERTPHRQAITSTIDWLRGTID